MRLKTAHELLDQFYEKAKNSNGLIKNPVAWALYQTWRRADDKTWKEGESNPNFCPNCGSRMKEGDAE